MKKIRNFFLFFLLFSEIFLFFNNCVPPLSKFIPDNKNQIRTIYKGNVINNFGYHQEKEVKFNENIFKFEENKDYNLLNSKEYSKIIKEKYLNRDDSRTELGINIELQLHYIAYLLNNPHGLDGTALGKADYEHDWSAALSEDIAKIIEDIDIFKKIKL